VKYLLFGLGAVSASAGFYFTSQHGSINSFLVGAGLGVLLIFGSIVISVAEYLKKKER